MTEQQAEKIIQLLSRIADAVEGIKSDTSTIYSETYDLDKHLVAIKEAVTK
ncbi:hypothetical protein ABEW34_21500 [Paenibacillus algorifonticola]|uniref:hypothetical protein n=1 Tax=Paenibacillus algorifonticola TaxID=684063 RepID=UPI003D2E790B